MGYRNAATDRLFEAILKVGTVEECYDFFEDLCTVKEILDMSQRLEVAFMLDEKKNYQTIAEKSGASTATISRVNKCFMYGSGGYKTVIGRMKGDNNDAD